MTTHCSATSVTERRSGFLNISAAAAAKISSTDRNLPFLFRMSESLLISDFSELGKKSSTETLYRFVNDGLHHAELPLGQISIVAQRIRKQHKGHAASLKGFTRHPCYVIRVPKLVCLLHVRLARAL